MSDIVGLYRKAIAERDDALAELGITPAHDTIFATQTWTVAGDGCEHPFDSLAKAVTYLKERIAFYDLQAGEII